MMMSEIRRDQAGKRMTFYGFYFLVFRVAPLRTSCLMPSQPEAHPNQKQELCPPFSHRALTALEMGGEEDNSSRQSCPLFAT